MCIVIKILYHTKVYIKLTKFIVEQNLIFKPSSDKKAIKYRMFEILMRIKNKNYSRREYKNKEKRRDVFCKWRRFPSRMKFFFADLI